MSSTNCDFEDPDLIDNDEEEEPKEEEEEIEEDEVFEEKKSKELIGAARKTKTTLSKYETTNLISKRAKALSMGDPPLNPDESRTDEIEIATHEYFNCPDFPYSIRREHPNGTYENWLLSEFKYFSNGLKPNYLKKIHIQ